MTSPYQGNAANGARAPAITVTIANDGDAANSANLMAAVHQLADFVAWLQAHAAVADESNTFTSPQAFQAAITLLGGLSMTSSTDQGLFKSGGGFFLGTSDANHLNLVAGNVTRLLIRSDGPIDALNNPLRNVAQLVLQALAKSDPADAAVGRLWFRSDLNRFRVADGEGGKNLATEDWVNTQAGSQTPDGGSIVRRDSYGRTQVGDAASDMDAVNRRTAQSIAAAAGSQAPDGGTVVRRDNAGRTQVGDAASAHDAVNLQQAQSIAIAAAQAQQTTGTVTAASGWTINYARLTKTGSLVTLWAHLSATGGGGQVILTLPAEFRPFSQTPVGAFSKGGTGGYDFDPNVSVRTDGTLYGVGWQTSPNYLCVSGTFSIAP